MAEVALLAPDLERTRFRVVDPDILRRQVASWRAAGEVIAFVPTMGALHDGHLSLVRLARQSGDRVVVSIFVNPLQFGEDEDLDLYPRDLEGDLAKLRAEGCDLVFAPSVETMLPASRSTFVDVEGPSSGFEADERPGHFRGVATIVTQLFHLVAPDVAVFGEKDAQQLAVVRKLVRDLQFPIRIVPGPIVREPDGLAMSSRNVYLSDSQRVAAAALSRSLREAATAIRAGERSAAAVQSLVRDALEAVSSDGVDYVAVVDALSFQPVARLDGEVVVAIAVRFGATRLLDNLRLEMPT